MREKLIELLGQVQYLGGLEEKVADHLLANGVIVLPCKVGDTVWRISKSPYLLRGMKVLGCSGWRDGWRFLTDEGGQFSITHFEEADIGKTVFLTREEAEAALKEVEE